MAYYKVQLLSISGYKLLKINSWNTFVKTERIPLHRLKKPLLQDNKNNSTYINAPI
jgi:hypothetical protein